MGKKLCAWKNIEDRLDKLAKVVKKPRQACRRCGRVANDGKVLCKPVDLPSTRGKK